MKPAMKRNETSVDPFHRLVPNDGDPRRSITGAGFGPRSDGHVRSHEDIVSEG